MSRLWSGRDGLSRALYTSELQTLEPICTFDEIEGATTFRSDRFPRFYYGNGILVHDPSVRSATEWLDLAERFYDDRHEHRLFLFDPDVDDAELSRVLIDAGYSAQPERYLIVDRMERPETREDVDVVRLDIDDDTDVSRLLRIQSRTDNDLIDVDTISPERRMLFDKTVAVSRGIGIEWYLLIDRATGEDIASAGIFHHDRLGRLQEVVTPPRFRKRGNATYLLRSIIVACLSDPDIDAVGLCCDPESDAERMYRGMGFRTSFEMVGMLMMPNRTSE